MLKFYAISTLIVLFDQLTKKIILTHIMFREVIEVTTFFDITHVHNYGAAFSFLHNAGGWQRYFLATLSLLVSVILPFYIKKNLNNLLIAIGLTLILGGAVGNLIDRFFLGYVIDFISIHVNDTFYWPVFNIADSAISIGVLLLIYDTFKKRNTSD